MHDAADHCRDYIAGAGQTHLPIQENTGVP